VGEQVSVKQAEGEGGAGGGRARPGREATARVQASAGGGIGDAARCVTLSEAKGTMLVDGPLRSAQGDNCDTPPQRQNRSSPTSTVAPAFTSTDLVGPTTSRSRSSGTTM
jgi:hypothetical protein